MNYGIDDNIDMIAKNFDLNKYTIVTDKEYKKEMKIISNRKGRDEKEKEDIKSELPTKKNKNKLIN